MIVILAVSADRHLACRKRSTGRVPIHSSPIRRSHSHSSPIRRSHSHSSPIRRSLSHSSPIRRSHSHSSPIRRSLSHRSPIRRSDSHSSPIRRSHRPSQAGSLTSGSAPTFPQLSALATLRILRCAQKMQGDVRFVPDNPTVVRSWRNVKEFTRFQFDHGVVVERDGGDSGKDKADVLHWTARGADSRSDVLAPTPARLISRATDRDAAEMNNLESAFLEFANFVGPFEPFQNDLELIGTHGIAKS